MVSKILKTFSGKNDQIPIFSSKMSSFQLRAYRQYHPKDTDSFKAIIFFTSRLMWWNGAHSVWWGECRWVFTSNGLNLTYIPQLDRYVEYMRGVTLKSKLIWTGRNVWSKYQKKKSKSRKMTRWDLRQLLDMAHFILLSYYLHARYSLYLNSSNTNIAGDTTELCM